MNTQFNRAVVLATKEIFQSFVGWDVKLTEVSRGRPDGRTGELSAIISITGDLCGSIVLNCSQEMVSAIAYEVLGTEATEVNEEIKDVLGEVLNMIIGSAKNYYQSEKDPFQISPPTIVFGSDYTVYVKSENGDISLNKFKLNGDNEYIGVCILLKR